MSGVQIIIPYSGSVMDIGTISNDNSDFLGATIGSGQYIEYISADIGQVQVRITFKSWSFEALLTALFCFSNMLQWSVLSISTELETPQAPQDRALRWNT